MKHLKTIQKILFIAIPVILVAIMLIAILPSALRQSSESTPEEWFQKQQEYIDNFQAYTEGLDLSIAAYVTGTSTKTAFLSELEGLERQTWLLRCDYKIYLQNHPVQFTQSDYYIQRGCEDVHACFEAIQNMIAEIQIAVDNTDEVLYISLSYADEIKHNLAGYQAARLILEEGAADEQ